MIPSIRQWTWYILERFANIIVGIISEFCHSPNSSKRQVKPIFVSLTSSWVGVRMAALTDDADYDAGDTFENVPSPLSDAGYHDNYYGRRLRTRCVLHSRPDDKTKLRQ
ncbi:unnamed protein product [Protopolystoma xenopodis]|uniref:Uncharacterized protein n=1 Tax=Protopolystoma xenopodis TaxID=117903 RepID=A0A448XNF8_9PLAT|nr:unnamed protein product [Protopolystoma xenopodis]